MDIKTCRFCKKTFKGFSSLCSACAEQLDKKYVIIRNYLDSNADANISAVAKDTEVDEKSIFFLIREGRLSLKGGSSVIACLKCGAQIQSGRYCDKCKSNLVHDLETSRAALQNSMKSIQPKVAQSTDGKGKIHILKDQ